jgi:hypothetical protein
VVSVAKAVALALRQGSTRDWRKARRLLTSHPVKQGRSPADKGQAAAKAPSGKEGANAEDQAVGYVKLSVEEAIEDAAVGRREQTRIGARIAWTRKVLVTNIKQVGKD